MRKALTAVCAGGLSLALGVAPAAAQAVNEKTVSNTERTCCGGATGDIRVSQHTVVTPSGNTVLVFDRHEKWSTGYTFHSHLVMVNGEPRSSFIKE